MSDAQLRDLERRYAAGDESVLSQLLSARFRADPSLPNANDLLTYQIDSRQGLELGSSYIQLIASHAVTGPGLLDRVRWVRPPDITIMGYQLQEPNFHMDFVGQVEAERRTLEVVRTQAPDTDLDLLNKALDKYAEARRIAEQMIGLHIYSTSMQHFISQLDGRLKNHQMRLQQIQQDRDTLRLEFSRYLELLQSYEPLEAGMRWYQEKCEAHTKRTGEEVLDPEDPVVYYSPPVGGEDQGVYSPECFFPFYEHLTDEIGCSDLPRANFLAAIEHTDSGEYHSDWEGEVEAEEADNYAQSLGITGEELLEGDEYYDEYRQFRYEFEETLLPKRKAELVEQIIDDTIDIVFTEYLDTYPTMPVKDMWQQIAEGQVEEFEIYYESVDWLDGEEQSLVSSVVNEPFERWNFHRQGWPTPSVIPLDEYSRKTRYTRRVPTDRTAWWELNTIPMCKKPPVIKVDTRAIGWRAAFGIEALQI